MNQLVGSEPQDADIITLRLGPSPERLAQRELAGIASALDAPVRKLSLWQRFFPTASGRVFAYYLYRYRYLGCFAAIGFLSILVELCVLSALPTAWPRDLRVVGSFGCGMVFSLVLNVTLNFQVPKRYLLRTTAWFVGISIFSFALNSLVVDFMQDVTDVAYNWLRLGMSGALFVVAYSLHRHFTFDQSRNFGIAVYASETENVRRVFEAVGHFCDHVHMDLVDESVLPTASPVCLGKITEARKYWRGYPVCLHVMSRYPRAWVEQTWEEVDWYLFSCEVREELTTLIFDCRAKGKKVGVVWEHGTPTGKLLAFLPHVDFVMVLGIAQPGMSGQSLSEEGVAVAEALETMRHRYGYDLMFDGGVKSNNISQIPGRYIVSASGVLSAAEPTKMADFFRRSPYRKSETRKAA